MFKQSKVPTTMGQQQFIKEMLIWDFQLNFLWSQFLAARSLGIFKETKVGCWIFFTMENEKQKHIKPQ